MIKLDPKFLIGSVPPLITPFKDGKVDFDTYGKLIEHQIRNGTHGILVNGTTSEPTTLTLQERNDLVKFAVGAVAKRVPVVAQTGSHSHAEAVELTEYANKAGADALLILTPYFIRAPQRGVAEYYIDLGRRTALPIMMYHIPGRSAFKVELATLSMIMEKTPHFVGIKHAFDDHNFVTQMLAKFGPEFRVFVGLEEFTFSMMAMGALGTMNAVANICPAKVAQMCNETLAGNMAAARKLHYEMFELMCAIFFDTNPIPMKYMMKRLGIIERNEHRLPMVPATPELEKRLDGVLERAGLLHAKAA
ncbi:MAG: 4-hydroxy-tetrahydrodipicolinate synthase [Betaproteobacteria bacterium]|nr:4-hydroxy-tetrahydrodipicolinate synthase [Betaproteobacteria bacterium]